MIALGQRLARRVVAGDLLGWQPVDTVDPRIPARPPRGGVLPGAWMVDDQPAHGLYERAHLSGMVDWAAAYHGWMLWRWRGPRVHWTSPLVSPWNPILAQDLVLDELEWAGVGWPEDSDEWTAAAILHGRKTGGYFGLRPRSAMRAWVRHAVASGLEVDFHQRGCWAMAAQAGTLGENFDLPALATEYARVLPGELGERVAEQLLAHQALPLITAAVDHEAYPETVCGLALGYPPEVTAGLLATRAHGREHAPDAAEYGAFCRHCDRPRSRIRQLATLTKSPAPHLINGEPHVQPDK